MNDIINEIKNNDNIVILSHINPDGDAVGSSLALYLSLKSINKNVDVIINDVPEKFSYLNGYNDIKSVSNKKYDLAIVVDTATKDRINSINILNNVDKILVIDHHISNTYYGDYNYVQNSSSCALIIYDLIKKLDFEINISIGEALYTGILTDSGGFAHGNVSYKDYDAASYLSKIINTSYVFRKSLGTITRSQFELKKIAIKNLEFYCNNKVAYSDITEEEIKSVNGTHDECSILVNIGREIEGVMVSIFTRIYDNEIRISLRSNGVDVDKISSKFGGGGHKCAAGISINDINNYKKLKEDLIKEVELCINEWNNSCK